MPSLTPHCASVHGINCNQLVKEVGRGIVDQIERPSGDAEHSVEAMRLSKFLRKIGRATALESCP
jgi:hypothetical protein